MIRAALVLGLMVSFLALAVTVQAADKGSHAGTVVSAGEGKLVMTDTAGKEHSHAIGADAKITIDGQPGKLEDLKAGDKITVTMGEKGKVATVDCTHAKTK